MKTVLSPCLVDGKVELVEVDLDACPVHRPVPPCAYTVWYAKKDQLEHRLRGGSSEFTQRTLT